MLAHAAAPLKAPILSARTAPGDRIGVKSS
jgi:hypothetical protein